MDGKMASLQVTRSIWGRHVGKPKTKKSEAPVPVISPLAKMLDAHRFRCGNPHSGPIFSNRFGRPLDLDNFYRKVMKDVFSPPDGERRLEWHGWHAFRRGLATNLNRLGIDDKTIQAILRHSNISTTQDMYIKSVPADAIAAMKQLEALMCANCASAN
jgi:integrase